MDHSDAGTGAFVEDTTTIRQAHIFNDTVQTLESCGTNDTVNHKNILDTKERDDHKKENKVNLKKFFSSHEILINRISKLAESQERLVGILEAPSKYTFPLGDLHESQKQEAEEQKDETESGYFGGPISYAYMIPKYCRLPEVEVSMNVNSISCFHHENMTFLADFTVMLDWLDDSLEMDKHFKKKGDNNKEDSYYFVPWVEEQCMVFNPLVIVENAGKELSPLQGADDTPRIGGLLHVAEGDCGTVREVLWLKKTMRFRGHLSCGNNDLSLFPFDTLKLEIRISGLKPKGPSNDPDFVNVVRKYRSPRLVDPVIRPLHPSLKGKYENGHRLIEFEKDRSGFALGELELEAYGSMPGGETSMQDHYALILGFQRNWSRYTFDFLIQIVMVILSIISNFVDPFHEEALSNRAGISMMLMLTLVTFTMERPTAIEFVSCSTIHDRFKRMCVMVTVCNAVAASFVVIYCRQTVLIEGIDREETLWCAHSPYGTTWADSLILGILLIIMIVIHARLICEVVHERHQQMVYLNEQIETRTRDGLERRGSCLSTADTFDPELPSLPSTPESSATCNMRKSAQSLRSYQEIKDDIGKMRVKIRQSVVDPESKRNTSRITFEVREQHYKDISPWSYMFAKLKKRVRSNMCSSRWCYCRRNRSRFQIQDQDQAMRGSDPNIERSKDSSKKLVFKRQKTGEQMKSTVPEVPRNGAAFILDFGVSQVVLQKYSIVPGKGAAFRSSQEEDFSLEGAFQELQEPPRAESPRQARGLRQRHLSRSCTMPHPASTTSEETRPHCNLEKLTKYLLEHFGFTKQVEVIVGIPNRNVHVYALSQDEFRRQLDNLLMHIRFQLVRKGIDCRFTVFMLTEDQEAMYELGAVDYLIQHSDYLFSTQGRVSEPKLSVSGLQTPSDRSPKSPKIDAPPKRQTAGGEGSERVQQSFGDLSGDQLNKKIADWLKEELTYELQGRSAQLGHFTSTDFFAAFGDLHLGSEQRFISQALSVVFNKADRNKEREVSWNRLANVFLKNSHLLQAFIRSRLFVGVIGSDSRQPMQVSCKAGGAHNRSVNPMSRCAMAIGTGDVKELFSPGIPVDQSQVDQWQKRVRRDMEIQNMHKEEGGLFVGISVAFDAAREAGIDGYLVPKDIAVKKMQERLNEVIRSQRSINLQDQLMIANLALVIEVIQRVLRLDAWIYFQCKWQLPTGEVLPAWGFGWYIDGEPKSEDCVAPANLQKSNTNLSRWCIEECIEELS
eukprot:gnl/MRDRNA2_/MRDRNA2_57358_c0_seq1.p1 gnl/MRDRNA2_/MRDRNA2_57358_c0~~gnl/MRDRNA2_/MRDRNA2_57358_c0_seq1.p1  ORF type:complete len:1240 (+),score=223.80 gnl/MRDRNA2_/MRDRNA2_57358_c0_seq1:122-3841(+)